MLCHHLKETKRMDNTEVIKIKVVQYFKERVNKAEKSIRTEDANERMKQNTEDVTQYLSTSTYTYFNMSNKEENNTSYDNEPKLKQSSILLKQKQENIALNTTENKDCSLKTTIQSSITNNNITYEQSKTKRLNSLQTNEDNISYGGYNSNNQLIKTSVTSSENDTSNNNNKDIKEGTNRNQIKK